ncbi:hypothetical protein Salat_1049400 [Sesamum alatum]|uniref:Peptidase M41 domain-containing protein n=1 Tax=Sesamum alatum TaxID=300844 RepID=A0AAE2CSH3_9LAMI|nr:hypothetical protein Salat_1049400 [Sesamum alatum]
MKMHISSVKGLSSVPAIQIQKRRVWAARLTEGEAGVRRRRALRRVDRELEKGNYRAALSLVKQLQAHPAGLLRGFGAAAAAKVPGTILSLDESKLSGEIEIPLLHIVVDAILHSVKCSLEFQLQEEEIKVSLQDFGKTVNAESNDSVYEDRLMCTHHEAGHFLVGYMLGVLPRRYKIPSVEDLLQDKFAGGNVEFVGFEFLRDVYGATMSDGKFTKTKLSKEMSKKFSCVILGGLAAEHLTFGYSELLHSDVEKLDRVHKWLNFTESKVESETRRAAEAAVTILWSYSEARSRLAEAMALGRSVGVCIETIERTLDFKNKSNCLGWCVLRFCRSYIVDCGAVGLTKSYIGLESKVSGASSPEEFISPTTPVHQFHLFHRLILRCSSRSLSLEVNVFSIDSFTRLVILMSCRTICPLVCVIRDYQFLASLTVMLIHYEEFFP